MQRLFLTIPFASAMTFLPAVFISPLYQVKFICFLCVSSLLATAYILLFVPNEKPGRNTPTRKPIFEPARGPVAQCLPHLNGALSLLLAVNALNWRGRRSVHQGFWILCLLPASERCMLWMESKQLTKSLVAMFTSIAARRTMLDVDIDELERLKYGYKGA